MLGRILNRLRLLTSANNDVIVRPAEKHDTRFVVRLLDREAKAGHFVGWPSRAQKFLFSNLIRHMLIPERRWPLSVDKFDENKDVYVGTQLFIGEVKGRRIGFIAIREMEPGSFEKAVEIWMVAVDPKRRGLGAGKAMVDFMIKTLEEVAPKATIIARCLPASEVMFEMLKRRGFWLLGTTPDGNRTLERKPQKAQKKRGSARR